MKLTVAIVTWNSGKFMRSCLEGLKDQTFKNFELLIVDNNSSDNTINIVRSEYPTAKIIINKDNLGFCGGHNIGIKNSIGEYYMPYNPDIIADENFLYKMLEAIELEDDIGSVSGKLLRYDLKNNCKTNIIDSTGIYFKKNRRSLDRGAEEVDVGQYEDAQYVFGPSGAAPLYRRSMLESIKLDNQYF
ncbi:glycosyltransferase, partial [Mycobacterium tuberculosis]